MATEVTKVIDPNMGSGYDYDSLYDWEAAQQGDLTARNEIAVAKCRCTGGTADTTPFNIDGYSGDTTHYIKIWTDPAEGYRHNGTFPTTGNYYRMDFTAPASDSTALDADSLTTKFIGIAFRTSQNSTYEASIFTFIAWSNNLKEFDSCVFCNSGGTSGVGSAAWWSGGNTGTIVNIINCTIYGWGSSGAWGIYDASTGGATCKVNVYNCTIVGCHGGIHTAGSATVACKNVGVSGATTTFDGTLTQTTCSTSTPTFVDASAKNYHLASNDTTWIGNGTNLYNDATYPFQTDIDGQDRGGAAASWDIGADEYVSAVTDLSIFASECVGSEGMFN